MPTNHLNKAKNVAVIIIRSKRSIKAGSSRRPTALFSFCVCFLAIAGCTVPFVAFGSLPVEGTVLDDESGEPLSMAAVIARALCCEGDELGRNMGAVRDGQLTALIPVPGESSSTDQIEISIMRDTCTTVFLFDVDQDVTLVDQGGLFRSFSFRITDPILVPACAENGDVAR